MKISGDAIAIAPTGVARTMLVDRIVAILASDQPKIGVVHIGPDQRYGFPAWGHR